MCGLLTYVFAIMINTFVTEQGSMKSGFEHLRADFATVGLCMWTLLLHGTLMDSPGKMLDNLRRVGQLEAYCAVLACLVFILLSALTVLNMLIGVLCEVVSTVGAIEKEQIAVDNLQKTVLDELRKFDDGDGLITKDELMKVVRHPGARQVLRSLEVDVNYLKDFGAMLFKEKDTKVPIDDMMQLILDSRGDLPPTVNNIHKALEFTRWSTNQKLNEMSSSIRVLLKRSSWSDAR